MFYGLGLMRERAFFFVFFYSFAVFSVNDCNAVDVLVARGDPAVIYLPPQITVFRIRHITYYDTPKLSTVTTVAGGRKKKSCSPFAFTQTHTHNTERMNNEHTLFSHWQRTLNNETPPSCLAPCLIMTTSSLH